MPKISVLMPTYNRWDFIPRAVSSLLNQDFTDWELWIIDDGSTDHGAVRSGALPADERIDVVQLAENVGLGAALNAGLARAAGELIAYLPDDDLYYRDHLASLARLLEENQQAVLAYSGVRYHYNRFSAGAAPSFALQPVQVVHRRTAGRWLERDELVTDDMERMFWEQLRPLGEFIPSGEVTCEWVAHPLQRHKILREPEGGINRYRAHYRVRQPLRFHTTTGNRMDEVARYAPFRQRPATPPAPDGLKILLVGELAYNPERILALEERGHRLYGLWMPDPYWYNYVGPLPFGHVTDLPRQGWQQAARDLQPDLIYALLNWQAVPWVHQVLTELSEFPAVWHFKEGPFICLEKGTWPELLDIYRRSQGYIFVSDEMRDWFATVAPDLVAGKPALVLDGDLPKREWFEGQSPGPLLSARRRDGEYHTVVPGRPIGLHPHDVVELAEQGIHLHFYGNFTHGQWFEWIEKTRRMAPGYLHLHDQVDPERWVAEFSQYDAGWLHYFESANGGELRRSNWDDINIPARLATLALAGLPVLQRANLQSLVATQSLVQRLGIGLFFTGMEELRLQLDDRPHMAALRENTWRQREQFLFDTHADRLIEFFRLVAGTRAAQAIGPHPSPAGVNPV